MLADSHAAPQLRARLRRPACRISRSPATKHIQDRCSQLMKMNKVKTIYLRIEKFSSEKPVLFWLITLVITSIPFVTFWKFIKQFLQTEFKFKGYEFLILLMLPFALIGIFKLFSPRKFKTKIIRELRSMKKVLEKPFELESTGFMGKEKITERYYHSEIVEYFDRYNNILARLQDKQPKEFGDLKKREDKPNVGKDWVYMTQMQVIKSDIELLLDRLT